jgi:GR25 family glycosyltransferase involved in LPS biosynthesis
MKFEIDTHGWAGEMRTAWFFIKQFHFKKAFKKLFSIDCPISPEHKGIFINFFGFGIYFHTN